MKPEISLVPEILSSVERALAEDIGPGDVTTNSIVAAGSELKAAIISKQEGVVAGLCVARAAFQLFDNQIGFDAPVNDGERIESGQLLAAVHGSARSILSAERTALNFLGRMSGIATATRKFVDEISGTKARILDTRKTAPNSRACDKMAVRLGGGENHRSGLYDMILIKDNHVDFAGSITEAVTRAHATGSSLAIEVEARSLAEVAEALEMGVACIMLDNMSLAEMRAAVRLNNGRAKLEASGNVTMANVRRIAETGVDFISIGALTHSVQALDITLKVIKDNLR